MNKKVFLDYDFDIHPEKSFMYHWTKEYMDETYKTASSIYYDFNGKTLYDIGVGRGRSFTIFKALGIKKVIGIDINKKETGYAVQQAKRLGIDLRIIMNNVNNDVLEKLPSNSCQIMSLMNILFCLPNDEKRQTIIKEVKRILKPGGILIILDMCKPSLMWFFSRMTFKRWRFRDGQELIKLFHPLKFLVSQGSNYFYFLNKPMDILSSLTGLDTFDVLNKLCKKLHILPSTKTYIFTK